MPRPPKPRGQAVNRSADRPHWTQLPPAKPFKRPSAKSGWSPATKSWWNALWASPMATTYLEADLPALLRLAEMVDARDRGELSPSETVAMTAIEDRFGLSPKARRALAWEVAQAERARPAASSSNVPKLRRIK